MKQNSLNLEKFHDYLENQKNILLRKQFQIKLNNLKLFHN